MNETERRDVFAACGADEAETAELLVYGSGAFDLAGVPVPLTLPLADEPCVATWEAYADEARRDGAWPTLARHLPRLRFPVRAGISESEDYRAATLRGVDATSLALASGLELCQPESVTLDVHDTPAGRIAVIVAACRDDFVSLVQALIYRNEPREVPASMGAAMVSGSNNWERVAAHRAAWSRRTGSTGATAWRAEFARLRARPEHYQDRFIVLQQGSYSAVSAAGMGLSEQRWQAQSLCIRREHECAHYFTLRVLGAMHGHLLDELLADYAGIVAAAGRYRADWFLRFLGLEDYPRYRRGGRLENYRGTPPLSDGAFRVLQTVAHRAAGAVEAFDERHAEARSAPDGRARMLLTLAALGLDALAAPDAVSRLEAAWHAHPLRWREAPAV